MDQPADQAADADYTPTPEDLREIVAFLRARSLDEAGQAGMMTSFRNSGVTIQVNIPSDAFPDAYTDVVRQQAKSWLEEHSPDRFVNLAGRLAQLSDSLANAGLDAISHTMTNPHIGAFRQQSVWRVLTQAAQLWIMHPDFKPLWAEGAS